MSRRRIDYIRPSLKKSGKRWFVEYTWRNPKTGIADRVRISKGFSSCKNQTERELLSKEISEEVEAKVREGLDPRVDDNRIYNDELEYNSVATIFSNAKSRNRTLRPLLSDYLIELKPTVSQKTYESYKSKCRILGAWLEREYNDENDVVAITDQVLDRFFSFSYR